MTGKKEKKRSYHERRVKLIATVSCVSSYYPAGSAAARSRSPDRGEGEGRSADRRIDGLKTAVGERMGCGGERRGKTDTNRIVSVGRGVKK
ncbi:hypothetical protein GWI33_008939 [Rhynchophorus ferrugineus]|uniref:Uncharacterized protein n=1 Tax=Rhynchophorus ferrugineus TaxID=354439 RepID=A0A834IFF3_RHYFE|nr:hypothetical protein GWI33_008939 [Rhynchophorus ferrugineus]